MLERNMFPEQGGGPSQPEQPKKPEATPEAVRRLDTRDLYTVPGGLRIIEFREALHSGDISKVRDSLEKSLAWIEGVTNGVDADNYGFKEFTKDTDDDREIVDLKNMFESVETSLDRPESGYLRMAIEDGLERTIETATNLKNMSEEKKLEYWNNFVASRRNFYIEQNEYFKKNNREDLVLSWDEIQETITLEQNNEERAMLKNIESLKDLKGLRHHYDSRIKVFEPLFAFTQRTCEDEGDWMELNKRSPKPDKGHWSGIYRSNRLESEEEKESNWGKAVSKTEDAIEKIRWGGINLIDSGGNKIPDGYDVYMNGFRSTGEFVAWAKAILPNTEINGVQRIDVLFVAWRQAVVKGTVSRLSWGIKEVGEGSGVYEFNTGNPPFSSDIRTKLIHNEKVRAKEWGWPVNNLKGEIVDLDDWVLRDKQGRVLKDERGDDLKMTEKDFQDYVKYAETHRTKPYKAISNSGHPLSIGRIGKILDDYESYTKLELKNFAFHDESGVEKRLGNGFYSLHDLSFKYGISRSSPEFPWTNTEFKVGDEPAGEPPHNTWGAYHLRTIRGEDIRTASQKPGPHIRDVPSPNELTIDFFETSSMRNWEKSGKLKPGSLQDGIPKNPFAWYLAGVLVSRSRRFELNDANTKLPQNISYEQAYRSLTGINKFTAGGVGRSEHTPSDWDVISDAFRVGAISLEERAWLENNYATSSGKG